MREGEKGYQAFRELLAEARKIALHLVPIRHRTIDPQSVYEGDFDFLLPAYQREVFLRLAFSVLSRCGLTFTINQSKRQKLQVEIYDPDSERSILMEFWSHLEIKNRRFAGRIFWETVEPLLERNETGFSLPPRIEILYYLSHLRVKNKTLQMPEVARRIVHYRTLAQSAGELELVDLLDLLEIKGIAVVADRADWFLWEGKVLEKRNIAVVFQEIRARTWEIIHNEKMRWVRRRPLVPFLGPDGVGKTTLIERLCQAEPKNRRYYRFKRLFRGSIAYQIVYPLLKRLAAVKTRDLNRNQVDDLSGMVLLPIALLRYPLLVLGMVARRKTWLSDRFFYDLMIDNLRLPSRSLRIRRAWAWLLPRCGLLVHLDAGETAILARKQELTAEAIVFYREAVFGLYLCQPSAFYAYVNTEMPPEYCVKVLERCLKRK